MSDSSNAAPAAPSATPAPAPTVDSALSEVINDIEPLDAAPEANPKAKDAKAPAPEAKKEADTKKKYKLKVNGKDVEDEIDFSNDEDVTRRLQKAKAFDLTSQELATLKKQVGDFVDVLKNDPAAALTEFGIDINKFAESHIQKMIDDAKKSPDQLAKEKMEAELKSLREEKEKLSKQAQESEMEKLRNQHASQIETEITDALGNAKTILPKGNPAVMRSIAETMLFAMNNGYPGVTAKDVIPLVEQRYMSDLKSMFDVFPEETIERVVGKNNIDRLRKRRISQGKANTQTAKQAVKETSASNNKSSSKADTSTEVKKSYGKFFSYLDE